MRTKIPLIFSLSSSGSALQNNPARLCREFLTESIIKNAEEPSKASEIFASCKSLCLDLQQADGTFYLTLDENAEKTFQRCLNLQNSTQKPLFVSTHDADKIGKLNLEDGKENDEVDVNEMAHGNSEASVTKAVSATGRSRTTSIRCGCRSRPSNWPTTSGSVTVSTTRTRCHCRPKTSTVSFTASSETVETFDRGTYPLDILDETSVPTLASSSTSTSELTTLPSTTLPLTSQTVASSTVTRSKTTRVECHCNKKAKKLRNLSGCGCKGHLDREK